MWQPFLIWFLSALTFVQGVEEHILCGACHVLAEEVNEAINKVDPSKRIQVGSFRVDPSGNQNLNEIPYARSDIHLTEVLEEVCDKTKTYMESLGKQGQPIFVPQNRKDGKPQAIKSVVINSGSSKRLKFACETLVEEHEDEIIKEFKEASESTTLKLCAERLNVCAPDEIYDMHTQTLDMNADLYKQAGLASMDDILAAGSPEDEPAVADSSSEEVENQHTEL